MFENWKDGKRAPVVHHNPDAKPVGEFMSRGFRVGIGRDGDYLHVRCFSDIPLDRSLQDGAPIKALTERIIDGDVDAAAWRLAERASKYARKPNNFWRKLDYGPTGVV
jgi:hypothetical protein